MNESADRVTRAAHALAESLLRGATHDLTGPDLFTAHGAAADLRRIADAVIAELSAEIERRSRPEFGSEGPARKNGFRSAGVLVSATTGTSVGAAQRLIQVGRATAPRSTVSGQSAPPRYAHVAAALVEARLSIDAASLITTMLDRVALRAAAEELDGMERALVLQAPGLMLDQVSKLVARAETHLDADGLEPKLEQLHHERSLVIGQEESGMVVLTAKLDPETAAPVKAAIEGIVTAQLRRRSGTGAGGSGADAGGAGGRGTDAAGVTHSLYHAPSVDPRSIKQMQADGLAEACRHILGCDMSKPLAHATTTVIVRIDLDALRSGSGVATIDGLDQPISAGAARRMAAAAEVIPCVLGGQSEILDWGRGKRLFTFAQRMALLERDGGCAFCGAPPGFTEAHHIRHWEAHRGPTDLSNGVMLCSSCHHRIHADGWAIRIEGAGRDATVWFDPPPHVDPSGSPRLGGRRRFDLVA